mgnify:CR=1 FL=1
MLWLFLIVLLAGRAKGSELDYYLFASTAPHSFQRYPISSFSDKLYLEAKLEPYEASRETIRNIILSKTREWKINPELVLEIVRRESNFNPTVCNEKFGCSHGQGLLQLIPSTNEYCEKKLGRKLNPFDAEDNIDCGLYLLKTDGIVHWNQWSGPYDDYD